MNSLNHCRVCLAERSDLEKMFNSDRMIALDIFLITGVKVRFFLKIYYRLKRLKTDYFNYRFLKLIIRKVHLFAKGVWLICL